jgi:hypothetical protein
MPHNLLNVLVQIANKMGLKNAVFSTLPSLHPSSVQKILLSTLFSNMLSLFSSLNVKDQVSHPYRTTGKIILLYILILTFSTADKKTEGSGKNGSKHSQNLVSS